MDSLSSSPKHRLSLWDAICLIVGIIIGASIYKTSPDIFRSAGDAPMGMLAWFVGGIVSLSGALCYAELASCYRSSGGDYTFLTRAYGSRVGFFFAWAELSVIRTGGSIAFMAYVFAEYATVFHNLGENSRLIYAVTGILGLTFINAFGMKPGRLVQNALTTSNIIGLMGIATIGLIWWLWPDKTTIPETTRIATEVSTAIGLGASGNSAILSTPVVLPPVYETTLALTMVLVFYAYGGWNEAAFIASEVRQPRKNITRALLGGTLLVTTIYIAVNLAYLGALGYRGVCESKAIAADMFALPFGEMGRKAISALIMVSALGSVHGLLFTGMRLYGTFGADHKLFAFLAGPKDRPHGALGALFAQAAFSLLLISIVEFTWVWRSLLKMLSTGCGFEVAEDFHSHGGIYDLVTCTAPVFWLFFFLTGCSLFVLRYKDAGRERPFRVPLYPIIPFLFVASCGFMLYRSTLYAFQQEPAEAVIVGLLIVMALPLGYLSSRKKPSGDE